MSKIIRAEYDDAMNSLQLLEPVEGFSSHETVSVTIQHEVTPEDVPERPWRKFRGILKGEDAESFGRAIDEAFPSTRYASDPTSCARYERNH